MYPKSVHVPAIVCSNIDAAFCAFQLKVSFRTVDPEVHVLTSKHGINKYIKTGCGKTKVQGLPLVVDLVVDLDSRNRVAVSLVNGFHAHVEVTFAHVRAHKFK